MPISNLTAAPRATAMMMMMLLLSLMTVALALGCASKPASVGAELERAKLERGEGPSARWSYEIHVDEALERMQLGLCIEGLQPTQLRASKEAMAFVVAARVRGGPDLARNGRSFEIETLGERGCLDLEIDLEAAVNADARDSSRRGDSIMLAPDLWLWYPAVVPADIEARARFVLPEGVAATVPWAHLKDGWRRLDHTAFGWNAWVAFGRYQPIEFNAAQCQFEVAVLDGPRAASDAGIEAWLRVAAQTSAQLHGRFPRERVSIVVIPTRGWGDSPVLFGMARRGGGGSAMLMLNADAKDHELPGEWVAAHELLHLGMPLVGDPWMSEGFVTYYTELLRARLGVLGSVEAGDDTQIRRGLSALARGFARGHGGSSTLAEASANMRRRGNYTRVYWGGAAIAFELDVRIRVASGGRRSLDDLVVMLREHALVHRRWAAEDLIAMMDAEVERWRAAGELEGEISPSQIIAGHLAAKSIPAEVERLEGLAIDFNSGHIRLLATPNNQARLRAALFEPWVSPDPPACEPAC